MKKKTITYPINLPSGSGKVQVRLELDGEVVYNQAVDLSQKKITPTFYGSGIKTLKVYFDDTLSAVDTLDFDS